MLQGLPAALGRNSVYLILLPINEYFLIQKSENSWGVFAIRMKLPCMICSVLAPSDLEKYLKFDCASCNKIRFHGNNKKNLLVNLKLLSLIHTVPVLVYGIFIF